MPYIFLLPNISETTNPVVELDGSVSHGDNDIQQATYPAGWKRPRSVVRATDLAVLTSRNMRLPMVRFENRGGDWPRKSRTNILDRTFNRVRFAARYEI